MLRTLFEWVDTTSLSLAWRESLSAYPILLTTHVVSMGLVAGVILFWDMRLAGMALGRVPVSKIQATMFPWMTLGLLINAGTGFVLVFSQPMRYFPNFYFWVKFILMAFAAINALYFHFTINNTIAEWEHDPVTPFAARMAGYASLALWVGIIITGRMIAYSGLVPAWWTALELG
jgi:hypothetical protein